MIDEVIIRNTIELRQMGIKYMILTNCYLGGKGAVWFVVEGLSNTLAFITVRNYEQLYHEIEFVLLNELPITSNNVRNFLDILKKNKKLIKNGIKELMVK